MVKTNECAPFAPASAASSVAWRIYVIAAAASLILSLWGAWAQSIPAPDSALYLRSAELLADGRWTAAVTTFGWPTYSALIATVMMLTGLSAFLAAQIVNALFAVITTVAFIGLVSRLANGDRLVAYCAAIIILLQPHLVEIRPSIVRDNGYLAFFVVTLYLVARDIASPSRGAKFAIGAANVAAALFRIEGFFLGALVLIYYAAREPGTWRRSGAILVIIAVGLMVIPGILLWTSGTLGQWLAGHVEFGRFESLWVILANTIGARIHYLKYDLLTPYGGGNLWGAYFGMTLGIVIVNVVRAVTIPLAILAVFAFFPKRIMPRFVDGFVLWFTFGQLPVLLVFAFIMLFLDKRYAAGMALVLDIPLAFLLAEAIRQWRHESAARFFLPIMAVTLVVVWAFSIQQPSKLAYLKETGEWISHELPSNVRILTDDSRIAYFSGRPYGDTMRLWQWTYSFNAPPTDAQLNGFDYFILKAKDIDSLPLTVRNFSAKQLVHSFPGKDGDTVFVYARR
jgi:hypothetical protein